MFILTVSEKGGQQSTFEFDKSEISIGRMKGNDIVLPKGNVSKRHSKIVLQAGLFSISDVGSTNGTFVNGRRIQGEQSISNSDKIYIGDFILQIENMSTPPPAPSIPPYDPAPPHPPAAPQSGLNAQETPQKIDSGFNAAPANNGSGFNSPQNPGSFGTPTPNPDSPRKERKNTIPASNPIFNGTLPESIPMTPPAPPTGGPPAPPKETPFSPTSQPPLPPQNPYANEEGVNPLPDISNSSSVEIRFESDIESSPGSESPKNIPIFVDFLENTFDEEFHTRHVQASEHILKSSKSAEFPKKYPPKKSDITKYTKIVNEALDKIDCGQSREELEKVILAECIGLGPIEALLDDNDVCEIFVHQFDQVFIRKTGNLIRTPHCFSSAEFLNIASLRLLGKPNGPIQNVTFDDGTKVSVSLPPLTQSPVLTIIKPRTIRSSFDDLIADRTLSASAATFLRNAVAAGKSILVAGPQSFDRSTLVSALAAELRDGVRTVAIEDSVILALPEYAIRLNNDSSSDLNPVRAALQMHPDRIILDSCDVSNSYDWVNAVSSGTAGSIASIFGTTTNDALGRLKSMVLLGANRLSPRGVREQVSRAVDIVITLNRTEKGFRVQQISEVSGVDFDSFRTHDVFYYRTSGSGAALHPTGYVPEFYEDLKHSGFDVEFNIFRE